MSRFEYYFTDALIGDLEALLKLNPYLAEEKNAWISKAEKIRQRLGSYLDLDRSEFTFVPAFLEDGEYLSQHPDSYARESIKIRECIKSYQNHRYQFQDKQKLCPNKLTASSNVTRVWWQSLKQAFRSFGKR